MGDFMGQNLADRIPSGILNKTPAEPYLPETGMPLTKMGFHVLAVPNGCEAWEYAQQLPFDLIITDYHVPGITGADLCRRLRRDPDYAATPIILCTCHARDLFLDRLMNETDLGLINLKELDEEEPDDKDITNRLAQQFQAGAQDLRKLLINKPAAGDGGLPGDALPSGT